MHCTPLATNLFRVFIGLLCFGSTPIMQAVPDLAELWQERVRSVVAVEFVTEREMDRPVRQTFGVVIDADGTIIFPSQALDANLAPEQFTDFRVYLPGKSVLRSYPARYLGHDELTGWEFLKVNDRELLTEVVPLTRYGVSKSPVVAQKIWGIGLRKKEEDFAPYFMESRVSIIQRLPQNTALASQEVAGPGLPVFDAVGDFFGLGIGGFGQTYLQFSERDRGGLPVVMIDPDECAAVLLADEVVPYFGRIPGNLHGRPLVWLGTNGLQPLDPEVARYLHLDGRSGLVVNDVLENSPAAAAGLQARDIILSINAKALPSLKPDRVLVTFFEREVDRRRPGDVMVLGILRGTRELQLRATLTDAPPMPSEVDRHFFSDLGLTVRDFTYVDGVARRVDNAGRRGVVVTFIKPNSPFAAAGLRSDDWITEIDEVSIANYGTAMKILGDLEADGSREECRIQVRRSGEPTFLKIKLHKN